MPESAQRDPRPGAGALRTPAVEDWETWPFDGDRAPASAAPPAAEPARDGEGGVDCSACAKPDERLPVDRRALAADAHRAERACRSS